LRTNISLGQVLATMKINFSAIHWRGLLRIWWIRDWQDLTHSA